MNNEDVKLEENLSKKIMSFESFYEELLNIFKGYFIDYLIEQEDENMSILTFEIECPAMLVLGKKDNNIALTFKNGDSLFGNFSDKNDADKILFAISNAFKYKIKGSNYKGMH